MNNNIIYRQDAINSIKELPRWIMDPNGEFQPVDPPTVSMIDPEDAVSTIEKLPSVQLEPLTDKEQRIFIAAMKREEEVCKQVDDECRDCKKPYENSLVRTCHEITRKVKGALWMIQSTGKLQ